MSLRYILGKSEQIEGVGDIHPVRIAEYDEFIEISNILYYRKEHFGITEENIELLDVLCFGMGEENQNNIKRLEDLFSMVLKKEVSFFADDYYLFYIDEDSVIHRDNYENVRRVIMKQNLMHEQKVYKDPLLRKYAENWIRLQKSKSIKMGIEDMITTVAMFSGKSYEEIAEFTIYQLQASFNRVSKMKDYDTTVIFKSVGSDASLNHFAEDLNMFADPMDEFKKGNVDGLNKALGQKG